MDSKVIGTFIRELREEKNISQQKLADMIPIDRSVLSKWERGIVIPPIDKMKKLCDFFGVTFDELISGERQTKSNREEHQLKLFEFIIDKDKHYRKARRIAIILVVILILFIFLSYYFFQTYNTEKIYRVYGESDNYSINDGLLIVTREKTYLKIGTINNEILDMTLMYRSGDKEYSLYDGPSDYTLVDYTGYNAVLNIDNIKKMTSNIFIKVDDEIIELSFKEDYKNNNVILKDYNMLGSHNDNNLNSNEDILNRVKREFECDQLICNLNIDGVVINYLIDDKTFSIKDNNVKIQYDIINKIFEYDSDKLSFIIEDDKLNCLSKKCDNYLREYNNYYDKYLSKYIV
jgi:transcriptional regulator with XRE-family HTH domain